MKIRGKIQRWEGRIVVYQEAHDRQKNSENEKRIMAAQVEDALFVDYMYDEEHSDTCVKRLNTLH